ncbi:MAG: glycosyltransferase family 2 protein [Balneolaceae bacterium]
MGFLAFKAVKTNNFDTRDSRRFAIIVPAHNEEKIIAKTIYSLFSLVYSKKLYDLFIIADNCTDNTAKVARNLGATVLERSNEQEKGKGYALRWAFDQIIDSPRNYDAVVVFDSDSLVSGNYLDVMNYYIEQGSEVIQSNDLVLPQPGAWSIEATRIGFLLYNYVKPMGRKVLGFNMGLRGNGMCFSTELLRKIPWQAWSLTEDVEYGLILMLKGIRIDFAPEANVWAQMPVNSENAESQRTRWEMGRYEVMRKYAPKFFTAAIREKSLKYLDVLIDLVTPPYVNIMLMVSLLCLINLALWLLGVLSLHYFLIWAGLALLGVIHLFSALFAAGADKDLYKSLFYIPVYVLWKIKVYVKVLISGREVDWVRTTRDSENQINIHQ